MLRILTAAVLLPGLWMTIKMAPGWLVSILALSFIGVGRGEAERMVELDGGRPL